MRSAYCSRDSSHLRKKSILQRVEETETNRKRERKRERERERERERGREGGKESKRRTRRIKKIEITLIETFNSFPSPLFTGCSRRKELQSVPVSRITPFAFLDLNWRLSAVFSLPFFPTSVFVLRLPFFFFFLLAGVLAFSRFLLVYPVNSFFLFRVSPWRGRQSAVPSLFFPSLFSLPFCLSLTLVSFFLHGRWIFRLFARFALIILERHARKVIPGQKDPFSSGERWRDPLPRWLEIDC